MPLISRATGNFNDSASWGAQVANSYSNTHPASSTAQTVGTNNLVGATFNGGSATFDSILIKIASRAASPSGTVTVGYYNNSAVMVVEATVNVSDIPADCKGWVSFKVASTSASATSGTIRIKTSASNQLTVFGTASTVWSHALRSTTGSTPTTNDDFIIVGDLTGAGTSDTFTITHNETGTATFSTLEVGHKGIWKWGTSASTNYYFKTSGNILFGSGSEVYIGDDTTSLPSTSTATIEIVPATNAAVGLYALSNSKFITRPTLQPTPIAQLTADVAASGTSLTTDISTGWKSGQTLLITGTGAVTEYEEKNLSADASGTSVPVNAVTNAHKGTGDSKAHVGNLTRSITIKGTSTSLNAFVYIGPSALTTFDMSYTIFENMGANVATKYGVLVDGTTSAEIKFIGCIFEHFTTAGSAQLWINSASISKCQVEDCIFYNVNGVHFRNEIQTTTSSDLILKNCLAVRNTQANSHSFLLQSKSWQVNNIYVWNFTVNSSFGYGVLPVATNYFTEGIFDYVWDNLQAHVNTGQAMQIVRAKHCKFGSLNFTANRADGALYFQGKDLVEIADLKITTNATNGIGIRVQDVGTQLVKIGKFEFNGNSFSGTTGIVLLWNVKIEIDELIAGNCGSIYAVSGTYPATFGQLTANKTTLTSVSGNPSLSTNIVNYVKLGNYNGANSFRHFYRYGTVFSNTSEFRTASPSVALTPNNASNKLNGLDKYIAVANGTSATVKVWVKKSSTYNGNQVQLMLKKDAQSGVATDTELTVSTSASNNAWEELSGTLPTASGDVVYTVYLTCDGTAGVVYYDDWSVT